MDDLTPVKGPPTPFEGRSAKVLALVVIALLVALIKPWGTGPGPVAPSAVAPASALPVVAATSPMPLDPWANYDHEIFGIYEPEPGWELWPAGYLVSFGYATRIESAPVGVTPAPGPAPAASGAPASGAPASGGPTSIPAESFVPASPEPLPSLAPGDGGPNWPTTIRITRGNNLGLIGVNMPLGYRIAEIGLFRITDGVPEHLEVVNPASDWPSHFTIIAVAGETRSQAIERWAPGRYRLELRFEPGDIERTIAIDIDPSPLDESAASGSPAP